MKDQRIAPSDDVLLQNVLIKTSKPVDSDFFFQEALIEHQIVEKGFSHNSFIIYVLFGFLAQKVTAGAMRPSVGSVETSTMMPPAMNLSTLGLAIR